MRRQYYLQRPYHEYCKVTIQRLKICDLAFQIFNFLTQSEQDHIKTHICVLQHCRLHPDVSWSVRKGSCTLSFGTDFPDLLNVLYFTFFPSLFFTLLHRHSVVDASPNSKFIDPYFHLVTIPRKAQVQ